MTSPAITQMLPIAVSLILASAPPLGVVVIVNATGSL